MRRWQRLKHDQLRLVTFDWQVLTNDFQQSAYKRIFCVFGGIISADWIRFVLTTSGTKKGHLWMQRIAETVEESLKGDWGGCRLITGVIIGWHYCNCIHMCFWPYFVPHQYSVNQLLLNDVFTAKTTDFIKLSLGERCSVVFILRIEFKGKNENFGKMPVNE